MIPEPPLSKTVLLRNTVLSDHSVGHGYSTTIPSPCDPPTTLCSATRPTPNTFTPGPPVPTIVLLRRLTFATPKASTPTEQFRITLRLTSTSHPECNWIPVPQPMMVLSSIV